MDGSSSLAEGVRTPPMGWNSWNAHSCGVTEEDVREAADAIVETGLRDVGYEYVIVDDCWMDDETHSDGSFRANPETFPGGIEALAEYVHDRDLKFGIYSSAGTTTCQGYPGSLGREAVHARQFASWGVDYLKYDNCGDHRERDAIDRYQVMGDALRATDREIVFSICEWGLNHPWTWGRNVGGHLWRATGDIVAKWETDRDEFGSGIVEIIDRVRELDVAGYHGPGGWNDPDMLQIGNGPGSAQSEHEPVSVERELTAAEERTHFSFWCLLAAPLMAGNDLRSTSDRTREVLTNEAAIAVNQDPLGIQGTCDRAYGEREVWSKRLVGGEAAVVLFNRGESQTELATHVDEIDVQSSERYRIHDLWTGEEWVTSHEIRDTVEPHDVTFVRVTSID